MSGARLRIQPGGVSAALPVCKAVRTWDAVASRIRAPPNDTLSSAIALLQFSPSALPFLPFVLAVVPVNTSDTSSKDQIQRHLEAARICHRG